MIVLHDWKYNTFKVHTLEYIIFIVWDKYKLQTLYTSTTLGGLQVYCATYKSIPQNENFVSC